MKKSVLLIMAMWSILYHANTQNPQWLNYTNGDQINALEEEGNYIWVGTQGGLVRLDKMTISTDFYNKANSSLLNNHITSIAIDANGTKWIGTWGGGLTKYDGTNWITYDTSNSELPWNFVYSIAIDVDDSKWIATWNGLANFDGTNWANYNTSNSGLPGCTVLSVAFNESGIPGSINENSISDHTIRIFPNPATQILNLELNAKTTISCFDIINMQGRLVKRKVTGINQKSIDIRALTRGVYIIRLHLKDGIVSKKFIRQ